MEGKKRRFERERKERLPLLFPFRFSPFIPSLFIPVRILCISFCLSVLHRLYQNQEREESTNMQEQYLLECPLFHRIIHGKLILGDNCSQSRVEPNIAVAVQFLLCCASIDEQERKRKKNASFTDSMIKPFNPSRNLFTYPFPSSPTYFQSSQGRLWLAFRIWLRLPYR